MLDSTPTAQAPSGSGAAGTWDATSMVANGLTAEPVTGFDGRIDIAGTPPA